MNPKPILRSILRCPASVGLAGLVWLGCTGGFQSEVEVVDDPVVDPEDATPNEIFLNNIRDTLTSKCGGCHGDNGPYEPHFLGATADDHYDKLVGDYPNEYVGVTPDQSLVYTVGQYEHFGGNAPAFSEEELAQLSDWIYSEAELRTGASPGENPPLDDCPADLSDADCALLKFSQCFDYTVWSELRPHRVHANDSSQGNCRGCHGNAAVGGFSANGSMLDTYRKWKEPRGVLKLVIPVFDGEGNFAGLTPAYRIREKGEEVGHPNYFLQTTYGAAIDDFVEATLQAYEQGGCDDDPGSE